MTSRFQAPRLNDPLLDLHELSMACPLSIPEMFLEHRKHHGPPSVNMDLWREDRDRWSRLKKAEQGVFVHVLTRFEDGMGLALEVLPVLRKAAPKSKAFDDQYDAIIHDVTFIKEKASGYRGFVAGKSEDSGAFTPGYKKIFREILPARKNALEKSLTQWRPAQIAAEARLRTDYHVVCEGLGAMTGIWGMNAAMRELKESSHVDLPGLEQLVGQITLIQRRNIRFGTYQLSQLARENYLVAAPNIVSEFVSVKPILEEMRKETFARWGTFPFNIDMDELRSLGTKKVLTWLGSDILSRPKPLAQHRVRGFEHIL